MGIVDTPMPRKNEFLDAVLPHSYGTLKMPVLRKEQVSIGALSRGAGACTEYHSHLQWARKTRLHSLGHMPSVFLTLYEGTCHFQGTREALMILFPTIELSFQADTGIL